MERSQPVRNNSKCTHCKLVNLVFIIYVGAITEYLVPGHFILHMMVCSEEQGVEQ